MPAGEEGITVREFDARMDEVRRAVDLAHQATSGEAVPLKQFFEAILEEQRRGMIVAEQEREKAAQALRLELARAIEEGDRALRDHIHNQIAQIREALVSAERLELQRFQGLEAQIAAVGATAFQHVDQLRRERELVTAGQQEAIAKADAANEKRFESVNEFRQQLGDQSAQFLPREVADAQFAELRKQIAANTERLNVSTGEKSGVGSFREGIVSNVTLLLAAAAIIVTVILANGVGP